MMAFVLVSCVDGANGDGDAAATTTTPAPSEPSPDNGGDVPNEETVLSLIEKGEAKVRVVYNKKDDAITIDAAKSLADSLTRLSGVKVYAILDFAAKNDSSCINILFGKTSYSASDAAMSALTPNSFSVTVSDGAVIVAANNVYLYSDAADALLNAVSVSGNNMTLDKSFSEVGENCDVVTLLDGTQTDYNIVYANEDDEAKSLAEKLKGTFATKGVTVQIYSDLSEGSGKEILIGDTNRKLSEKGEPYYLNAHIGVGDNGDVAVTGNLAAGVQKICDYLNAQNTSEGRIDIPPSALGIVAPKGYGNAPEYTGGGEKKLYCGWDGLRSYYVQAANATEKDYEDYIKKLESEGFALYYKTDAQDSEFSIYTDGYNIVNLSYIEYTSPFNNDKGKTVSYVNIDIDCIENSALPNLVAEGKKITDVQLTLVYSNCAFIIRLEDGRFVVVDGGSDNEIKDLIYKQLVAQNVRGEKPTIAAWVITHTDGDHVGGFSGMLEKYADKIILQSVIVNSPSSEKFYEETPSSAEHTTRWAKTAYTRLEKYAPDAKIIIAHAGQRFEYLGLTVDVLGTYENLYDKPMKSSNHSNTVYSFTMPTGRMIFTGDAQNDNCKILAAIYAEELQADVVQYSHHGYNGGDKVFYDMIYARYGIWTNNYEYMLERELYGKVDYNHIDPKSKTVSLATSVNDNFMILKAGMTKSALAKFIRFEK